MNDARSLLFVPATSERKIDRAFASNADGVIIDLEDAVAVSQKAAARTMLASILAAPRTCPAYVRVNAASTPYCFHDLMTVPLAAVTAIVVPKVESAADVQTLDWVLCQLERERDLPLRSIGLLAIIETAKGLTAIDAIAGASPRLRRLALGAVDLASDLMTDLDDEAVAAQARFAIARASRSASLERPIDTPLVTLNDEARLRATAMRARAFGFSGKLCIHPAQIAIVNEVFSPTAGELERAARIVAAFEAAEADGRAALSVDGEMVDYPVVERARRTLAQAGGTR
jgi:citrate lyase subunit beta/citryl-CoA lyase